MLSPTEPARPQPHPVDLAPTPATTGAPGELRAELLALNELLRERKSVDHAARAYLGMWGTVVAASVAGKLAYDSEGTPWVALPFALLALGVAAYVVSHKRRQWKLDRVEQQQLARQRELRTLLGLDEAVLPSDHALSLGHSVAQA